MKMSKTKLNNRLFYLALGVLIFCFVFTFAFIVAPEIPGIPTEPAGRRLFVCAWNFGCTLMWITILRIQVFNGLIDKPKQNSPGRSVTPWVRFWFLASISIGIVTLTYISRSFATGWGSTLDALTVVSVVAWILLTGTSISLFFKKDPNANISGLERSVSVHRALLIPTSLIFFFSTLLFPVLYLI